MLELALAELDPRLRAALVVDGSGRPVDQGGGGHRSLLASHHVLADAPGTNTIEVPTTEVPERMSQSLRKLDDLLQTWARQRAADAPTLHRLTGADPGRRGASRCVGRAGG